MKQIIITDEKLLPILNELIKREPIFHHPELGNTRQDLEKMTIDDFWEVGASGNIYFRQEIINTVLNRFNDPNYIDIWEAKDFNCREIAPDNYLLTYTLIQNHTRITRRSTIWRYEDDTWKVLYHQGTVAQQNI